MSREWEVGLHDRPVLPENTSVVWWSVSAVHWWFYGRRSAEEPEENALSSTETIA